MFIPSTAFVHETSPKHWIPLAQSTPLIVQHVHQKEILTPHMNSDLCRRDTKPVMNKWMFYAHG